MENKEYIFMETASGDRTNIMASFQLWNKEMFMDQIKKQSKYHGRYRYGTIGGYVSLVKDMSLEEFDSIFSPAEFTKEQITDIFRKEISLKYGIHGEQAKIRPLGKKDLERGFTYETVTGDQYIYLGEVEQITDKTYLKSYQSEKKSLEIEKGFGFASPWQYKNYPDSLAGSVDVLKSIRKFSKKVETPKIELKSQHIYETGEMHWSSAEKRVTLNLL